MDDFICNLWPLLLAAALICLLIWVLRTSQPHRRSGTEMPSILWMSPASRAALGNCAEPRRLRKMTHETILARLSNAIRPPGEQAPSDEQVKTWPLQAAMLATGDHAGLRAWQDSWGDSVENSDERQEETRGKWIRPLRLEDAWLGAALFLLLAFVVLLLAHDRICRACIDCDPPIIEDPQRVRFDLSTDLLFDYKLDRFHGDRHEAVLRKRLSELFGRLEGIKIQSIEGHTDPVGGTEENRRLGEGRANTIRQVIIALMNDPALKDRFSPGDLPPTLGQSGAKNEDAAIWEECFRRYQLDVRDPRYRPLRDLHPRFNRDNRPLCSAVRSATVEEGRFPACASPYERQIPPGQRIFALRAENFREMTSCLSPMRHVVLKFTFERQTPLATDQLPENNGSF